MMFVYDTWCLEIKNIKNKLKKNKHDIKNIRTCNFPEFISENIVRLYINKFENRKCEWAQVKPGDLRCGNSIIEVKCVGVNPSIISFGSIINWQELYVLDASNRGKNIFKIYKIPVGNNCDKFKNIKINETQTFAQ